MLSLGIDIGTSGVRTAVVDEAGRVLSFARAQHLPQDPKKIDAGRWWDAVQTCLARQSEALQNEGRDLRDIGHIAVDGTSGSMVLVDANLRPVTRALLYNSTGFTRAAQMIAKIAPPNHITQGSGSALARAMSLLREAGNTNAAYLMHQADFIAAKLCGMGGHSDVMNALKTGVCPETGVWPDWMDELFPSRLLPQAHPIGAIIARISQTHGFAPTAMLHAGTTDSIAAFLAAAPARAGVAVTSLGSTLAIKLLSPMRIDNPSLGIYSHRVGDVWLAGGASNTGGRVLRQFFSDEDITRLSAALHPEIDTGLEYYPLTEMGERFPTNNPMLQPHLRPRPPEDSVFLQGIFEGIARIEAACYEALHAQGAKKPTRILSVGGGSGNAAFSRIRARYLGQYPEVAQQTEAAVGTARIPFMS